MRRALLVIFLAVLWQGPAAVACGDKFLIIGRGASYRNRYVAVHPASILLYGEKAAGDGKVDVRRILQRAGHRVDLAADGPRMEAAIRSRKYDFVIAPLEAIDEAEGRVRSLSSDPLVVPILFASDDNQVRQAEKRFECIARPNSSASQRSFLAVLDDAMDMRLKGQIPRCRWSK